ncbi:unnamed protein product, partial [Adineta steineri]
DYCCPAGYRNYGGRRGGGGCCLVDDSYCPRLCHPPPSPPDDDPDDGPHVCDSDSCDPDPCPPPDPVPVFRSDPDDLDCVDRCEHYHYGDHHRDPCHPVCPRDDPDCADLCRFRHCPICGYTPCFHDFPGCPDGLPPLAMCDGIMNLTPHLLVECCRRDRDHEK